MEGNGWSKELVLIQDDVITLSEECEGVIVKAEWTNYELYTSKNCLCLSRALAEILEEGSIVELFMMLGPFRQTVHAGICLDGKVFDIEGAHNLEQWISKWSNGLEVQVFYQPISNDLTSEWSNDEDMQYARSVVSDLMLAPEFEVIARAQKHLTVYAAGGS